MKKRLAVCALLIAGIATGCNQYEEAPVSEAETSAPQSASIGEITTIPPLVLSPESSTPADNTTPLDTAAPDTVSPDTSAPDVSIPQSEPPSESTDATTVPPIVLGGATTAPETEAPATTAETTASVDKNIDGYRQIGGSGILVAGIGDHYWGIMFFGGTYDYCDLYVKNVKEFQNALPEVNVCSMVIPTSVDFYNPDDYKDYSESQKDKIEYVENELSKSGVTNIKVYDVLASHTSEPIYARTDHHWKPLGAYYAAQKFCNDIGVTISPLEKYKAVTCPGYVGSMYYYSEDEHLYNDPEDYTVYYSPNADKLETTYYDEYYQNGYESNLFIVDDASSYYLTFLGGDEKITHVKTDVKNGRNLVVIKESYGNALIPFLTEAFENIYVLDLRYCEKNAIKFCKDVGATDLLFANCAYTVAGGNCEYFDYIREL